MTIERSDFDSVVFGFEVGWTEPFFDGLFGDFEVVFLRGGYPCHLEGQLLDVRYDMMATAKEAARHTLLPAHAPRQSAALARYAFEDHSRYFRDCRLLHGAGKLYQRWVVNAHERGDLYVHSNDLGDDLGFVAVSRTQDVLRLDLIAVHPDVRQQGIGRAMIEDFLALPGPRERRVKVEVGNLPAVRAYLRAGFRIDRVESVQHIWRDF